MRGEKIICTIDEQIIYDQIKEKSLEETLASALTQIEEKGYEENLLAKGFKKEKIRKYGFAFEGKTVLKG